MRAITIKDIHSFQIFGVVIIAAACVDMGLIKGFAGMETTGHETDAVLIAVGVLIILVAAFGCFGAWKESTKLLYIVSRNMFYAQSYFGEIKV